MKRSTKVWLLTATVLVLLGITIFGGVVMVLGWDLGKLSTASYETNAYEINEKYEGITIVADTADVTFLPSQDGKTSVVCFEEEKIKHKVEVKDGTLFVTAEDTKTWYERIGINFCSPSITVCLPEGDFGELSVITITGDVTLPFELSFSSIDVRVSTGKVKCLASALGTVRIETTTGDVEAENISVGSLSLSVSTGDIDASGIKCKEAFNVKVATGRAKISNSACQSFVSDGSTGDVILSGVVAEETLLVERSTGNVKLDGCDAGEICIKTTTGSVTGSLLSGKTFVTSTGTGSVRVPDNDTNGGRCRISTTTGSIKITVK